MRKLFPLSLLPLLLCAWPCVAQNHDYLPLTSAETNRRFPVKLLGETGGGRPVPFEADGYFQEDGRGIYDLVDLDGDRRAELVYMNFDDGYWVTNLYEAEAGRWRRV